MGLKKFLEDPSNGQVFSGTIILIALLLIEGWLVYSLVGGFLAGVDARPGEYQLTLMVIVSLALLIISIFKSLRSRRNAR